VCVSYWANRLQPLPADAPNLFVTLNPIHPPAGVLGCGMLQLCLFLFL
jgi:predicted NAD/FAD-binding protein